MPAIFSTPASIISVSEGRTHQASAIYRGNGVQCTANAFVAALQSVVKKREIFNTDEVDEILRIGDDLYVKLERDLDSNIFPRYLAPENLPSETRVGQNVIMVDIYWLINGLYAPIRGQECGSIKSLCEILRNSIFNQDYNDASDSLLFVGGGYTVSFWRYGGHYYIFNSHAVNHVNVSDSEGLARLFRLPSLESLAAILLKYNPSYGSQYSITRVRVTSHLPVSVPESSLNYSPLHVSDKNIHSDNILISSNTVVDIGSQVVVNKSLLTESSFEGTINLQSDEKLIKLKPVVVLDEILDVKLELLIPVVKLEYLKNSKYSISKRGRPKKQKRGRKLTRLNAHLEAVKRYIKNHPEVRHIASKKYTNLHLDIHRKSSAKYTKIHPEVHRNSAAKYDKNHPKIHRDAQKKYTKNNADAVKIAKNKYNKKLAKVQRNSKKTYVDRNGEFNKQSIERNNTSNRNIDTPLRRFRNLIGEKCGDELNSVKPFTLKKTSLYSVDIYICQHCGARLFEEERNRKQWCCSTGSNVQNLPALSEDFYSNISFLKKPRAYNNMFAFSAMGVSHGYKQPEGISFLKIQGRVYHRVFDLGYEQSINNLGLYISDCTERESHAITRSLDLDVIRAINHYLHNVNPYIECFKRLNAEASDEAFILFQKTSRATHGNILGDQPVGREISAIISTDRDKFEPRCIAVWKVGERKPHTVDIMHPLYECFQYPLLYPEGNPGWYPDKIDNKGKKLTQAKYVRCLFLTDERFSKFDRLSEEWLVDMFCRISEERLRFLQRQQTRSANNNELRTAPFQELVNDETIAAEGIVPGRIYLPNSFTGGPRYMKVKYLDCMAIVNRLGPPSFFITFTCNPKWPEIKESLAQGQKHPDPRICARVFNLRLAELIRDIRSGKWFGKIDYLTYVIEFQKRGLPHAHICFRVEGGGPVENTDIDKFCRADIPNDSEADGRLKKAVLNHMIHGPCGPDRDNLPCYDKEKKMCTKHFPKRETDVTFCDDRGFVHLRRSSSNEAFIKYRGRDVKVNDLYVVSYNAALLLKYDAHINVEISSLRNIIKYLFKYMTKGPDEARVVIVADEHYDEIEEYVTKRYIGSSDAAWRVLEFDVTSRSPNVKQLPVHLENRHSVIFRPNNVDSAVSKNSSDLTTYMERPSGDNFNNMTYLDFYEKFIVHCKHPSTKNVPIYECTNGKFITPRQRGELVARLFWVAPNRGEQFYLRLLLTHFPCRSYGDLISLGGPNCTTFQEAARIKGLANDHLEYERAMEEASTFFTGPRLRRFFVLLAVNGAPVASLWDKYKNKICEDALERNPNDIDNAYKICLLQIGRMLLKHGTSLSEQGLPTVEDHSTELGRERDDYNIAAEKSEVLEWLPKLSSEQRLIYDYIDKLLSDKSFRESNTCAIFIDGPAGTGKTTILNVITGHVRGDLNGIVLTTASSAIAAQNYRGGVTAHSMFKFPIDIIDDSSYWNITNGSQRAELIYHANIIIYDEAPMAHKYLVHLLDRSLRDLMKVDKLFGGKIIIFAGDFRQIPPVVPNARTNSDVLNSSVKSSPTWQRLKTFSLLSSQRCREDPGYADFLLKLGSNKIPLEPIQQRNSVLNLVSLESIEYVTGINDLIDFVFPFLDIGEPSACADRAILCTRNDAVRAINRIILDKLPGEMLHFYANDKIESESADQLYFGPDALNRMQPPGVPDFDLKLKEGCVCMIIRNLSFADGLINGTKVIVESTSPNLITVRKPYSGTNNSYMIPRILFKAPIDRNSPYEMCRRQFPLQVSYAMTIHKSQGQTIARVGVDLRSDVFSHGQLYVALGRVRKRSEIKVLIHPDRVINNKVYTKNVIIPDLINSI